MTAVLKAIALPATLSDTELSRRIAQGDMHALEQLMRLHNRTLFRTARAILRDDAEAEDAVQEAYLQAYRSIGAFRGDAEAFHMAGTHRRQRGPRAPEEGCTPRRDRANPGRWRRGA